MPILISIVIPALNEAHALPSFLPDVMAVARERGWDVLVVDDGSSDGTSAVAAALGATVLRHEQRRGYGAALKTGIRATRHSHVAIMDGDGQHSAASLVAVTERAGVADMVVGARRGLHESPLWRRPGKWAVVRLARYIARQPLPDLNSGLRVMDRSVLMRYLHLCPDSFSFTTTVTLAFLDRGRTVAYVPITTLPSRTRSQVTLATGFDTLLLLLRLATLFQPLRLFVAASLVLAVAGVMWSVPYALSGRGISIGAALLILTGVQLLFAGLLADQVAALRKERFERTAEE